MDKARIGDVKYSILAPKEFHPIHGKDWALVAGQDKYTLDGKPYVVKETKLGELLQIDRLPDARGMFIRGMDDGRQINPGRKINYGSNHEDDSTRMPRKRFSGVTSENGRHRHRYGNTNQDTSVSDRWKSVNDAQNEGSFKTSKDGAHKHKVFIDGGDKETRPVNIALYVYIKVN